MWTPGPMIDSAADNNVKKLMAFQNDAAPDPPGQGDSAQPPRGNHGGDRRLRSEGRGFGRALPALLRTRPGVYRWVEHTAELELELEASSEAAVFEEALAALAELVGDGDGSPRLKRSIEVEADERALLLVEWLNELIYLAETEQFVPERIASLEVDDGRLRATVEGHRGGPSQLVKAVTLHRLEFRRDDTVGWRARVVLDV